jgi:VIT1/CCC1 family predicted Fe2+/Mn2+ transporter
MENKQDVVVKSPTFGDHVLSFVLTLVFTLVILFIISYVVSILWNNGIVPAVSGAKIIGVHQAFYIFVLCVFLFKHSCSISM